LSHLFAGVFGAFLGLALLKFGNPPIMEKYVTPPNDVFEFLLGYPWPISWAYGLLCIVAALGLLAARPRRIAPRWLVALPLVWLVWQLLAATQTVDGLLTTLTLKHFAACVVCFYLGFFSLGGLENPWPMWIGLFFAFVLVLWTGVAQHFGGLEETRRYFYAYIYPKMPSVPQEYLKRISSGRIFGTLFYPNSLAGVLLLLTPPMVAVVLRCQRLTIAARRFLAVALGAAVLACLYWSGSKGGWLLALLLGIVSLLRLPHAQRVRTSLVMILIIAGLAGFFWKYSGFFRKGATSVSARMDYWQAAAQTAITHPLFGTGPGTFAIPYEKLKRPESEMSRMVHNDYLEQASDSGFIGFLAYIGFITAGLVWGRRALSDLPRGPASTSVAPTIQLRAEADASAPGFWVWLGLLGWALQGLFEFGLYVPALAWTAFAFLGWLLGSSPSSPAAPKTAKATTN